MSFIEEEREQQKNDTLSRGVGISFAFHGLLIAIFTVKAAFFPSEQIDFSQAVRVDMIALPDKTPPATVAPPAAEEAKPALPDKEKPPEPVAEKKPVEVKPPEPAKAPPKKPDDAIALEKVKNKQQNAIDKLKAMAALDKIKEDVEAERKKSAADKGKKDDGAQKIKGNILSPGSAVTGLAKLQHDAYVSDLDKHIKQNWSLPEWLAKRELKAQVRVQFDSRGNLLGRKIVKSSGNPSYDDEVLATIDRSAPFPAPPEKLVAIVSVDGILFGFPE